MVNIKKDKLDHVMYSYAICLGLITFMSSFGVIGVWISVAATSSIGIIKELIDKFDSNADSKSELQDLMADAVGIALAFFTWYVGVYY